MALVAHIYNPQSQPKEELIKNFVIRQKEFKTLFDDISKAKMKTPEQHYLIQGQRGMGKTTLIMRLYYEIQNSEKLNKWLVPVLFSEEQYAIRKLYKLWEHIAIYLEDHDVAFAGLFDRMDEKIDEDDYEEICLELLLDALKKEKKKLILLMDNFGDLLEKFTLQERQRLREVLLTIPEIRIIAGSSRILEHTFSNDEPFHEFFKIVQLDGLNKKEVTALLKTLGEADEQPRIMEILKEESGRVESLRRLSGGVPRTMVLLYEIFLDEETGDSFNSLENLLDRVTPLYKHRMDELKGNQQEIVEVIAFNWDGMAVKEIARRTRMESNVVSAQLTQLEKNRIIDKVKTSTKNNLYRLSERFFNIWYIMRYGRKKDLRRVKWLVEFLRDWCNEDEIKERALKHMDNLKQGILDENHAFHITETLAQLLPLGEDQDELIAFTKDFFTKRNSGWVNSLTPSDSKLIQDAISIVEETNDKNSAIQNIKKIRDKESQQVVLDAFSSLKGNINFTERLLIHLLSSNTETYLATLITSQMSQRQFDALDIEMISKTDQGPWLTLALGGSLCFSEYFDKALKILLIGNEALPPDKGDFSIVTTLIGTIYENTHDYENAIENYLRAIKYGDESSLFNLARIYHQKVDDYHEAEKYYLLAIKKSNKDAMLNLATLYDFKLSESQKALKYYEMAVKHGHAGAICRKSLIEFKDINKSEKSLSKIEALWNTHNDSIIAFTLALFGLWHNKFDIVPKASPYFMSDTRFVEVSDSNIQVFLALLLAKEQYQFAHRLFEESTIDLKDRFKPIYYALMHFMQDEYPDEILKMGPELKETVDEIIAEVKQLAIEYA